MSIGERLRATRIREKKTAKELSKLSGVPEKTIYRIETGEVIDPKLSSIQPLIKALNATADEILFGKEDFTNLGQLKQTFLQASQLNEWDIEVLSRVIDALNMLEGIEKEISKQLKEQTAKKENQ